MTRLLAISVVAFGLWLLPYSGDAQDISVEARVIDGMTLEVQGQRLRLFGIDAPDQFLDNLIHLVDLDPAAAGGVMSTAAVFQHPATDIGFRRPVENGFADGDAGDAIVWPRQQV